MDNRITTHWDAALLEVTLLGAFHAGQKEIKLFYKDPLTGEQRFFAISPRTPPTRPMDFPYNDVEAWLAFGCTGDSEWIYIGFSDRPNLDRVDTTREFEIIEGKIPDNEIERVLSFGFRI